MDAKINLSQFIDHTLLKPEASSLQILKTCQEAIEHNFFGVCVNSFNLPLAKEALKAAKTAAVCVVGFPLGACSTETKAFETSWCVDHGAHEIDMVINIAALKDKNSLEVENDIKAVVRAANGLVVKVIIETALLSYEEKITACKISLNAGAHFVKTCTGFNGGQASVEDIVLMKSVVGTHMKIKASGGIKSYAQAIALIEAGASRLGTSSGIALIQGQPVVGGY